MSKGTPEQYLSMYLSEQIPESEWYRLLNERADVREFYNSYRGKSYEFKRPQGKNT